MRVVSAQTIRGRILLVHSVCPRTVLALHFDLIEFKSVDSSSLVPTKVYFSPRCEFLLVVAFSGAFIG